MSKKVITNQVNKSDRSSMFATVLYLNDQEEEPQEAEANKRGHIG